MWKKLISVALVFTLVSLFAAASAEAGAKQRNMWKGAGIALGAVALGAMAHKLYTHTHPAPPPQVVYYPPPEPHYCPPPPEYVPGHWEIIREWVPGTWERVWVPGHYDSCGNWVAGHYEDRQTPGRYVERRVWVEGYHRCN
ncbi:MAG: hypothetical protein HXY46_04365 [Syntrophaceae bacterium]|nr:hypothetical protein [Syntrophaceae bacterium]